MSTEDNRKMGAELARALYQGTLTFKQFLLRFPESEDPELEELLDLVEHEPQQGGIFGVSAAEHESHMSRVHALIEKLANT